MRRNPRTYDQDLFYHTVPNMLCGTGIWSGKTVCRNSVVLCDMTGQGIELSTINNMEQFVELPEGCFQGIQRK